MLSIFAWLLIAVAPQTENEQKLQKFYSEIWSPYCKGNSLLECPSGQATELRDRIRSARERGMSFDEIKTQLEADYGKSLSMTPQDGSRGRLAYFIPWIAFLSIIGVLIFYWKSRVSEAPKMTAKSNSLSREMEAEIQERMK